MTSVWALIFKSLCRHKTSRLRRRILSKYPRTGHTMIATDNMLLEQCCYSEHYLHFQRHGNTKLFFQYLVTHCTGFRWGAVFWRMQNVACSLQVLLKLVWHLIRTWSWGVLRCPALPQHWAAEAEVPRGAPQQHSSSTAPAGCTIRSATTDKGFLGGGAAGMLPLIIRKERGE